MKEKALFTFRLMLECKNIGRCKKIEQRRRKKLMHRGVSDHWLLPPSFSRLIEKHWLGFTKDHKDSS
jgi:hypothetical protein